MLDELDNFLITRLKIKSHPDPLAFWSAQSGMGTVSRLARRYLCVPSSSSAVERGFSVTGHVARSRRSRLTGDNIALLTLLHDNLDLVQGEAFEL